jgi:hypothetical protein
MRCRMTTQAASGQPLAVLATGNVRGEFFLTLPNKISVFSFPLASSPVL